MYPNLIKSVPKEGKINFTIIKVYWVWNTYNGFTWDINCWRACYLFLVLYVINFPYLPSLRQLSALPGERAEQKLSSSTDLVRLAERRKPRGNAHVCDCGHDPLTSLPPPPHTHTPPGAVVVSGNGRSRSCCNIFTFSSRLRCFDVWERLTLQAWLGIYVIEQSSFLIDYSVVKVNVALHRFLSVRSCRD